MSKETKDVTKKFIEQVETLISKGVVRNRQQIVNDLGWDKSMMSQVCEGSGGKA